MGEEEERAVIEVLRSGSLCRFYGPSDPKYVLSFEAQAREYYGVRHAIAVNSCTGALECAIAAIGLEPGDEVILPAFMWVSNISAVVRANAIPILCEIDDSFTLSPPDIENKISSRTKLIIAVHMAGGQCDMDAIMMIANRHGIPVLEDVAQSNGGELHGRKLGTIGAAGVFSLQLHKNITSGEGGLIVTNDKRLAERSFAAHDIGLRLLDGHLVGGDPKDIVWGSGRRMSELAGALASVQMQKLSAIVRQMRRSHDRIISLIADLPGIVFRRLIDSSGSTGSFIIIVLDTPRRASDIALRLKEGGMHHVYRLAEYLLHIYSNITALVQKVPLSPAGEPWSLASSNGVALNYAKGACPKSDDLFSRSLIIPIASCLTSDQEEDAANLIIHATKIAN